MADGEERVKSGTAAGSAAFRLAGGVSLRLGAGTRLRFADAGTLELGSGAVYVDSPLDAGASLEIRTPFGSARNVGTQFELSLEADGLRVRVREGRLELRGAESSATVAAGEELRLSDRGPGQPTAIPIHGEAWQRWQRLAAPFELEGATLGQFLRWLGRETGRQIRFADAALAVEAESIRLHGDLQGAGPEESAPWVLETCGLEGRVEGGTFHVSRQVARPVPRRPAGT
ncbi:MAG: FecR family protein [Holophagales bacterium]|nr:FecR family protein [Holophagales bacterium]